MGDDMRAWLATIQCEGLLPALGELGVDAPEDIQWLSASHIETLVADLRPVQQAKFKGAMGGLYGERTLNPAPSMEVAIVPEWTAAPQEGGPEGAEGGAFAELQAPGGKPSSVMAQTVNLGGKQVPLVAVVGATLGLGLLLLLVVALVPNSCNGVVCGKFGACQNGDCACQAGYSSIDKQACVVDRCYRVDCGTHGTCQPTDNVKAHEVFSTWTCDHATVRFLET